MLRTIQTTFDFPLPDYIMPRKKKVRKCTGCRRPCKDHLGPTGDRCQFKASALSFAAGENVSFTSMPSLAEVTTPGPKFLDNPPVPSWPCDPPRLPSFTDDRGPTSTPPGVGVTRPDVTVTTPNPPGSTASTNNVYVNNSGIDPRGFAAQLIPGHVSGHHPVVTTCGPPLVSSAPGPYVVQSINRPLVSAPPPIPPGGQSQVSYANPIYRSAPPTASDPWCQPPPANRIWRSPPTDPPVPGSRLYAKCHSPYPLRPCDLHARCHSNRPGHHVLLPPTGCQPSARDRQF